MKKSLLALLLIPFITFAQTPGQWTWMKGTGSVTASTPVYGTQGIVDPANTPGSLYESCEWKDTQGNFWIFGGLDPNSVQMGDLWKFDPVTTNWTWMKGPGVGNQNGVYGIRGIPDINNQPGGRAWGIVTWVDNSGTFWMYGGYGYDGSGGLGYLNDLWSYNVSTNKWTWVSGSNVNGSLGTYGSLGVANPANVPPAKCEISTGWSDASGNLWIFGGFYDGLYYNDMWKYNIASNEWTWMNGADVSGDPGNYGTQGVASPTNNPPSRYVYARWKDAAGNFWMFGGDATALGEMNDMWMYNPGNNEWTWVNGPNTGEDPGVAGPACVGGATYRPTSRYENRAVWTDACGNFYNFGGYNETSSFNDLWQYNPTKNQWKFINGGAQGSTGSFGSQGISSSTNMPPSLFGSNSFTDAKGNFWFFGGRHLTPADELNDVWRFVPDTTCNGTCGVVVAPPVADLQSSDTILCTYDCINFSNLSTNATSYQWSFAGGMPATSTDVNPQNICYIDSGLFNVTLVAINGGGTDTLTFTNYINVSPSPPTPTITQSNDTLFCSFDPSYTSYQWYYNSTLIAGDTTPYASVNQNGNYNVAVANKNGCSISVGIIILGVQNTYIDHSISLSPNPARDRLLINDYLLSGTKTVSVYNMLGKKLRSLSFDDGRVEVIDISSLSAGIYFVQIANESKNWTGKFVKE